MKRKKPTKTTKTTSRKKSKASKPRSRKSSGTKPKTKSKTRKTRKTKTTSPPKGFVRLGLSEAHDRIKERLSDTRDRLESQGFGSRLYTHEYKNGTIDGEITVHVPRGVTAVDVSDRLERAFQTVPLGLGRGFWYALGVRMSIHKDEADDRSGSNRVRGMDDLMMYYRRVKTTNLIDSYLRSQKIMIPGAEKKYKRKVEIVYLRLHWNQGDAKPER